MRSRKLSGYFHRLSRKERLCWAGLDCTKTYQPNGILMLAAMDLRFISCSKRLIALIASSAVTNVFSTSKISGVCPHMECAGHAMLHAPYVVTCNFLASIKSHKASIFWLTVLDLSASLLTLYCGAYHKQDVHVTCYNFVGEDKSAIFSSHAGPQSIFQGLYKLPLRNTVMTT